MSIIYCEKHDRRWDSDKLEECPLCESESKDDVVVKNLRALYQDAIGKAERYAVMLNAHGIKVGGFALSPQATQQDAPDWEGALRDLLSGCDRSEESDEAVEKARAFLLKHRRVSGPESQDK